MLGQRYTLASRVQLDGRRLADTCGCVQVRGTGVTGSLVFSEESLDYTHQKVAIRDV